MSLGFAEHDKRIFSIPAGADFLGDLADALVKEFDLANNPEALADALIYVPNRRSERALAFAVHRAAGGKACLLPMIRALGDLETSDPPPSAEAALADLPPVISPAERLGRLTRLVMAYFEATSAGLPAVSCLSAARELARLLDQAALSGDVAWDELDTLVPNAELATHWQKSLEFLKIITDQWPVELDTLRAMDPYARRLAAAEAMVAEWQKSPPDAPVIIAGSTGATPASRLLMQTALELPNGYVVLPGLDLELTDETLQQILQTPSHPQFALASTLTALNLETRDVATWSSSKSSKETPARRRLIHQALAPAQSTADWTSNLAQFAPDGDAARFVREALNGLTVLEASDESEEALLAAILMRETLETEGQTAALVTPDAGLARRVSAMLTRWHVHVPPSAGRPLPQTDAGSLALLVAQWLVDLSNPVALMAVLNHPRSRFDPTTIGGLDIVLRGPRVWQSWSELTHHIPDHEILLTLTPTASKLEPLAEHTLDGETWLQAIAELAQAASLNPYPWAGEDGAAIVRVLRELADLAGPLGEQPPGAWLEILLVRFQ